MIRSILGRLSTAGLTLCILGSSGQKVLGCSTFFLNTETQKIFGKNLDWHTIDGLVVINKRGMSKKALLAPPETPMSWISTYGSITFNQVAREFPFGGMNEKGLVVEQMWLDDTLYPGPDKRPVLGELQWIQYHLDTAASVKELLSNSKKVRMGQCEAKLHFLVSDPSGDAAIIEFLQGKMVVYTGSELPVTALTNTPYSRLLAKTRPGEQEGGNSFFTFLNGSEDRFSRLAKMLSAYKKNSPAVDYGFRMLDKVSQGSLTVWSIVYDLKNLEIHYKTRVSRKIKSLSFKDFDFDCSTPVRVVDVNVKAKGPISGKFVSYNKKIHRALVTRVFQQFDGQGFKEATPQSHIDNLVNYPDTCSCLTKGAGNDK